jgi:hypothetical protein
MKAKGLIYSLVVLMLRVGLVVVLFAAGWFVYQKLPQPSSTAADQNTENTTVQIILRRDQKVSTAAVNVPIELYPIDIVAVRNEFFTERRAGERFDDFRNQRMKGRSRITSRFDTQGQATVSVSPGNWWIYVTLPGEEELEWRLPVSIGGRKQIVELTPQNAYTRSKSF